MVSRMDDAAPPPHHPHDIHPPELPPHLPEAEVEPGDEAAAVAAAAAAAEVPAAVAAGVTAEETMKMKRIEDRQAEQAQLILSMQATINNLSAKQNELEEELQGLRSGQWIVQAQPAGTPSRGSAGTGRKGRSRNTTGAAPLPPTAGLDGTTEDYEIDAIIESRKARKLWPLKRKYCASFTQEVDLLKVRFHRSEKHQHRSVRIPKVDKNEGPGIGNKEGRLICRLCSGKTINRNTSWMCATCMVPLCVDVTNGDQETSCHARWHGCQDLVAVNATLNTALRERRESKKRSRDGVVKTEEAAAAQQQQHEHQVAADAGAVVAAVAPLEPAVEVGAQDVKFGVVQEQIDL